MEIIGWIGSAFLLAGLAFVGGKRRDGFLLGLIGEVLWVVKAIATDQYDLASICAVFALVYVCNWFRWRPA